MPSLEEILETLEAATERKLHRKIDFFEPYAKQAEFYDQGLTHRERLFMAGNQLGKTYAGAVETAYHLTGEYPVWWLGRRFRHPVRAWCAGETSTLVRDGPQFYLCGLPGVADSLGTGLIPQARFVDKPSLARGVTDAFDTIQVEHRTDGIVDGVSTLTFKSYEQGKTKFQSTTVDFIWLDEEPPEDVYGECLPRITSTKGMIYITFTPLQGMSNVVIRFLNEHSPDRGVTVMTIDECPRFTEEEKAKIIAGYLPHEREARSKGVPMLGSGKIFQVTEASIAEPPIEWVPAHWSKLWGIDFGIDHPFAAVLIAWDRENDVIHILHVVRMKDGIPLTHALPIRRAGGAVPVAWPHDGNNRDKGSGEALSSLYRAQKLKMLPNHAAFEDGSISTEAGVLEMDERMRTGRFRVAAHLQEWWEEFRMYHRKDGQIVKEHDDIMSATRIAVMAKRFAKAVALGPSTGPRRVQGVANDVDFEID